MVRARKKAVPKPWIGTKISATIIDFGEPLLVQLPPDASLEFRKHVVDLIVMFWNANVMAKAWGHPEGLVQMRETLGRAVAEQSMAPEALEAFETLSARHQEVRFANDPRAVGQWRIRDTAPGQWNIHCDARLPPSFPAKSPPAEIR